MPFQIQITHKIMVNICQPSACENNTECKNGNDLLPCQLLAYDLPHSKSELPLEHRKWPVVIQWVLSIVNTLKEQMTISRTNSVHFFLPPKSLDSEYGGFMMMFHATGKQHQHPYQVFRWIWWFGLDSRAVIP